jgi:tetratricopeptide (TPR) repeat protein
LQVRDFEMNDLVEYTPAPTPGPAGVIVPDIPQFSPEDIPEFARAAEALRATGATRDPKVQEAINALGADRLELSGRLADKIIDKRPRCAEALSVKAEIAKRAGRREEAELLYAECVEIAPDCALYRYNHAVMLSQPKTAERAFAELEILLRSDPRNPLYRMRNADLLKATGKYAEAAECYRELADDFPRAGNIQVNYGSLLRTIGHREECIAALRKAAAILPSRGDIWWSLASLKVYAFADTELAMMERTSTRSDLSSYDRVCLHFALGKAYDDRKEYEKSFSHYVRGNAVQRIGMNYNADQTTGLVSRAKSVYTPDFLRERQGFGCSSEAPIFVLGLQRSGSTLIEQILGSHSAIEPAGELNCLLRVVAENVIPKLGDNAYPRGMDRLQAADLKAIGERYLELVAKNRNEPSRPYFVDKCPYNLCHMGLIQLILPNAKVIDARRHPLGCCLANFTMNFQHAPPHSYNQTEVARFYADYVKLMTHFDRVLPGTVCRVIYEHVVENLETEVRRMLEFIGLPFEPACLEYYKNPRQFSSFSNEQVRSPIFREGLDRWKNYEPFLGAMKTALGPVLDAWPNVSEFED